MRLMYVWLVGRVLPREQFKSVRMVSGCLCVTQGGITEELKLCADNLDTMEVCIRIHSIKVS